MRKLFTIYFLLIALQMYTQNQATDKLQQRVTRAKESEKAFGLNNKTAYEPDEFQAKYQSEKKDEQIKLQKITIENKDIKLRYSLGVAAILLIALIIIIFLYWKRNRFYKQLVYQNHNIAGKNHYETDSNHVSNYHNTIDEVLSQHIFDLLKQQMISKIYLEPSLTIKQLADKCETNRSYLSLIIHEKYRVNFNNFINKYRIEEAKRILSDPENNIPLKVLYERLGFSSYTRFYEAFKKSTGVTPSFFLKTIKKL